MTNEQILEYIRSDKVKKAIIDGDYAAEIDDQYALAYALGSDKIDLLGVNAAAYYEEPNAVDTEAVMLEGYEEIKRVFTKIGRLGSVPYFEGARSQVTKNENYAPSDSPAARNIIKAAHEVDDILFVLVTGPCTNVVSACLIDPSIMDKICVLWLGGECIDETPGPFHEWNLYADYAASQMLLNLDIPLVMLPCGPIGSEKIFMVHDDFMKIDGDSEGAEFFRRTLPLEEVNETRYNDPAWRKVMCDLAAPAVLAVPDSMEITIRTSPIMCDDHRYASDSTRRKILYGVKPDSDMIVEDAIKAINKVTAK
ncbi:MAG: nucleoside hydrolase [Clostridia bacterium]|nr:nucleoside hydrolase [Clostridia bacterium]